MKKERNHFFVQKRKVGLAAFVLPVALTLLVMLLTGQYPFGENTLLIWDMDWQYNSFFAHLHDILHGDASPWYSFSRAIGGDMVGVSTYYLISPFNLLFYFFDAEHIYAGIALLMVLKIGALGWAMNLYLYSRRQATDTLIFSTAYALSGYVAGYFFNIMWLDGLILLPLMVLGIEQLVERRRFFLYVISLGLGVITNFYIGYMLCIFSVMYFVCYFFLLSERKKSVPTLLLYGVSSLMGGALSACTALPTLYSMQDGKSEIDFNVLKNLEKQFDYSKLIYRSFMGTTEDLQMTGGSPLIYCGVFVLLLIPVCYLAKGISWKKKVGYLLLQLSLLVSLNLYGLCAAWQAFNMPNGSPYRFSFLYIFVMLMMADEAYGKLPEKTKCFGKYLDGKRLILLAAGVVCIGYLSYTAKLIAYTGRSWICLLNLVLVVGYLLIMTMVRNPRTRNGLVLAVISVELCGNALVLYHYSSQYESTTVSEFDEYVDSVAPLAWEVKGEEELYRIVLTGDAYRTVNDNMLFNLYGLDSYTSVEKRSTQQVAFQLGYYTNMVFGIHYEDGSTRAAESLLGVKYLIGSQAPESGYDLVAENGNLGLYKNKNALPFAMFAEQTLLAVSNENYNTFEYQNALYAGICDEVEDKILLPQQLEESGILYNCVRNEDGTYSVVDPAKDACVEYRFVAEEEGYYYLQYISSNVRRVDAIKAEDVVELGEQSNIVKQLGYFQSGDEVFIWCFIGDEGPQTIDNVYLYRENETTLAAYAKKINEQQVHVTHQREDHITVTCNNDETYRRYLFLSIPYDPGWTVSVDGSEATPYIAMENLMAIGVEPGEHVIELDFIPQGLAEGLAITGGGFVFLMVSYIIIFEKRKRSGNRQYPL